MAGEDLTSSSVRQGSSDGAARRSGAAAAVPHPLEALSGKTASAEKPSEKALPKDSSAATSPASEAAPGSDATLGAQARARHLRSGVLPDGYRADWVRRVAEKTAEAAGLPLVDWLGKEGLDHFFAVEPVTGISAPAHLRVTIDPFEAEVAALRVGPTTEAGETVAVFKLAAGPMLGGSASASGERRERRSHPSQGGRACEIEISRVERPDLFEALTHSETETPGSDPASS